MVYSLSRSNPAERRRKRVAGMDRQTRSGKISRDLPGSRSHGVGFSSRSPPESPTLAASGSAAADHDFDNDDCGGSDSRGYAGDKTVSSRGCNRLFIISVLLSTLEYLKSATHGKIFPAPPDIIARWLRGASTYCNTAADTTIYGGPAFNSNDPSTHWTEPQQFLTWWKNFVERRR